MGSTPVTLDFSKAQPITPQPSPDSSTGVALDFSKAQPIQGTGPTIGPTPSASDMPLFGEPWQTPQERLTMPLVKALIAAHDKLRDVENFTQEGRAAHPIQAQLGDIANRIEGFLIGNPEHPEAGIGTGKYGMLNNPVTSAILPVDAEATPALASAIEGGANLVKSGVQTLRGARTATTAADVAEETPGLIKQVVKGEKVAQPAAQATLKNAATAAAADTGVEAAEEAGGVRTFLDDTIAKAATKERGLYDTLNEAAGTDMKDLYDRKEELLDTLDDPTQVHNRKALSDELSTTQKAIKVHEDQARLNGVDPSSIDDATAATQQRYALQEVKKGLFNNENVVQGDIAHGAPESINVDAAIKSAQRLNKPSRFAPEGTPTRLMQAFGEDGANNLLRGLYQAQKAGQSAVKAQKIALWVGGAVGLGGGGALYRSLSH